MDYDNVTKSVAERVAAGASFLDSKVPNWYKAAFDWDSFSIQSSSSCMLAQLVKTGTIENKIPSADSNWYWSGAQALGIGGDYDLSKRIDYGFTPTNRYRKFKPAWMAEVQQRYEANSQRAIDAGQVPEPEPEPEPEPDGKTITLNVTEQKLLGELLSAKLTEVETERLKLKEHYRLFLNPEVMRIRALLVAVRDAS